jgi:predicted enzyme related to lactoylglutathione lyase
LTHECVHLDFGVEERASPDSLGKNRVHLVLHADDRAAEVERLVSLGATIVHDKDEWNVRWTTLTDPQGNEFCVATH